MKTKTISRILLLIISIGFGILIYKSCKASPVEFKPKTTSQMEPDIKWVEEMGEIPEE